MDSQRMGKYLPSDLLVRGHFFLVATLISQAWFTILHYFTCPSQASGKLSHEGTARNFPLHLWFCFIPASLGRNWPSQKGSETALSQRWESSEGGKTGRQAEVLGVAGYMEIGGFLTMSGVWNMQSAIICQPVCLKFSSAQLCNGKPWCNV